MSPVTYAVVGAGSRGYGYSEFAKQFPDRAKVVAVAEPRRHYRELLAREHSIPAANVFDDWKKLARAPKLADAVMVCTQDQMHTQPAVAFAAKGYHILLEKPMAPTAAECRKIAAAVRSAGVMLAVCHVLRYTAYTKLVRKLIDQGAVGEVVSIEHLEPVGHWHMAHSFVRGNWRNEAMSNPMLLAKSCHDLDWLAYMVGTPCRRVSSFGSLFLFRADKKPAGAADRCLDCRIEEQCPYSAVRVYLKAARKNCFLWPVNVLTSDLTVDGVTRALREGPYGRCVWACDNDVVDHQIVNMEFEGGRTASFNMIGFTEGRDRQTRIFGARGELRGDGNKVEVFDFAKEEVTVYDPLANSDGTINSGHGGGDFGLMDAFTGAIATGDPSKILSGPAESLQSHLMVFAAEQARRKNRVVTLEQTK